MGWSKAVTLIGFLPLTVLLWHAQSGRAATPNADWLTNHWRRPIPAQGQPPNTFSPLEASLQPAACSTCHTAQGQAWQGSVHSKAMSPGLVGQLLEMPAKDQADCLSCHAPLHEQSRWLPGTDQPNPAFDITLQRTGVSCSVCHVRGRQRFGPPRGPQSLPPGPVHGGATLRPEYESAQFCASCHQFGPDRLSLNGKPLENTVAEWQASPYAQRGVSCQSCHMPDRRHGWPGIHDPAIVRHGIALHLLPQRDGTVQVTLTNSGTGHAFPSYVTPQVTLRAWLTDRNRQRLTASHRQTLIARKIDLTTSPPREISDSRLLPGQTVRLTLPRDTQAAAAHAEVWIEPDHYYTGLYRTLLTQRRSDRSRELLDRALQASEQSAFVALDATVPLP